MRILLAEDNPDILDMLMRRLQRRGHDVVTAVNGMEAVASATAFPPDIILMDLAMPVMSGIEAARALRAHSATRAIKIIALTAHATARAYQDCLIAGIDAFATKPVDFEALMTTVEAVASARAPPLVQD